MKAWFARRSLAGIALVLFSAGSASAGPRVSGSVLAAGASPEAALVELFPLPSNFERGRMQLQGVERPEPAVAGRPTTEGRFRLEAPQKGLYRLVVRAPGKVPVQIGPLVVVEDLEVAPVALAPDIGVRLDVVDSEGLPVEGAWAIVSGDEGSESGWRTDIRLGKTGADGRLTLPRKPGEKLSLAVFSPARGEALLEGFEGGKVRMPPAGPLRRLRVLAQDGTPRSGILLRYGSRAWPAGLSDAEGAVRLPPAAGEPEELRLVAPDGAEHALPAGKTFSESDTVRLPAPRSLPGRVVDARNSRPVAGALAWNDRDPGAFVMTDADGRYRLGVPAEMTAIEVVAEGYLRARVGATPARARLGRPLNLGLEPAAQLAGLVTGGGRPIAGALVEAVPHAARGERELDPRARALDRAATDAEGRFRLRRLEPGQRYELRARREGYFPAAVDTTVFAPPASGEPLRFELAPVRALSGQVKDSQGRALEGVEIDVQPAMRAGRTPPVLQPAGVEEAAGTAPRSDAQGRFLLSRLPAATVDAVLRKSGFAPLVLRRVRIPPGAGPFDLGKIVLNPGAALRGRVVDTASRPVTGAEVFLLEEEPRPFQEPLVADRPKSATSRTGEFAFRDLTAAVPLHLFVRARGYRTALVRGVRPPREQPLVVTLEPGLSLRGRVVDEAGSPVPGAFVEATWYPTLPDDPERRETGMPVSFRTRTVRSGRFEIEGLPRGEVELSAQARGFLEKEIRGIELPRPEGTREIEIALERGAVLTGRVTTTAGDPVAGARVQVGEAGGASDRDGQYLVEGAPLGPQRVSVVHSHHRRLETTYTLRPESNTLDLQLEPGVEVSGRAVDERGRPVSGARVALQSADRRQYNALTAADGGFVFPAVERARYRLSAEREGYAASEAPGAVTVEREPVAGLEVTLREGAAITGLLLGLEPAELSRVAVEASLGRGQARRAEIDAEGRYRLASLEPGDWTIRASLSSGEREVTIRQPVRPDDRVVERDLEFRRRLRLTGRVLVDDEPLENATVSVRGRRFSSERNLLSGFDGSFLLDDLEPDTYDLGVSHAPLHLVHNQTLELTESREVEIRLQPATVRGRVVAANSGAPLPDARVSLRHLPTPETPEFLVAGFTGPDGAFSFSRVPPGTYQLEASADGYSRREQPLSVAAGTEPPELDLRLEPTLGLELDVRLADGTPPPFVHLLARGAAGQIGAAETLPVDPAGRARLSTLPEGRWTLLASAQNAALAAVEAQVPGPPLSLTLPATGRLHVRIPPLVLSGRAATLRVLSPAGQPLQTLEPGGSLRSEWVLFAGQITLTGLPEGPCVVNVEASDGQRWSGAGTVAAGQEFVVILE